MSKAKGMVANMRKSMKRAISALLCLTLVSSTLITPREAEAAPREAKEYKKTSTESRIPVYNASVDYAVYLEQYADIPSAEKEIFLNGSDYSATDMEVAVEGNNVVLGTEGSISWKVNVPSAAMYEIEIEYCALENKGNDIQLELNVNGEIPFAQASSFSFGRMYTDESKEYQNVKGNQAAPSQVEYIGWQTTSLEDVQGHFSGPLKFYLKKGNNTITFNALKDAMIIKSITLKPVTDLPSYQEYFDAHKSNGAEVIKNAGTEHVQGEDTSLKSSASFRPQNDRTSAMTEPYDATYIIMNTIGGSNWSKNGDWLEWNVEAPQAGLYKIAVRFKQGESTGFSSIREVSINGEVPFEEARDIRFAFETEYLVQPLKSVDGTELYFYLEEGMNTIRFTVSLGGYADIVKKINNVIEDLSGVYQSITAITGTAPNSYQDYQLLKRLPNLTSDFARIADAMEVIENDLIELTGGFSDISSSMERSVELLRELIEKPSKIQNKVTAIADNITSLGSNIMTLSTLPLTIDWLQIVGEEDKLPKAEGGFFQSLKHEILSFIGSFTNDYSVATEEEIDEDEAITVWVSTGRDQMDVIRRLINQSFTSRTGIPVNLKLVDSGIIMTAIAAGTGPDVAIGVSSTLPMELAFRGASYPLSDFADFAEVTSPSQFMPAALDCFELDGKYYGIPDQMSFSVMFYRKDILAQYGIAVPETWDDLISIIPTLATYNMEAYLDKNSVLSLGTGAGVGSGTAINSVYLSMLYQKGADLYNDEGTAALMDSRDSIDAFTMWTEFYTKYGFSVSIDFITRFRLGSVPIAIMDISNYNSLSISAPEINGKWSIGLVPGTLQEDGTIDHTIPAVTSSVVMIKDTVEKNNSKDKAWEFIKWWVSGETQNNYGTEMEAVLGSSARYMVANLEAFDKVFWSVDIMKVLQESLPWLREIKQVPGGYLTGRNLSNAFYQVIENATDRPIDVITEYNESLNEEIAKKRSEFGMD